MDTMHRYIVRVRSTKVRSGVVASEAVPQPIKFSAPPEFQGEGGVWTPEDFFVASVVTCFVSTFSGISDLSKLSFVSLEVEAEGILERDSSGWKFTEIKLRPSLKLTQERDRERATRMLEKAERTCLIARSISAKLTVEASVSVAEEVPITQAG